MKIQIYKIAPKRDVCGNLNEDYNKTYFDDESYNFVMGAYIRYESLDKFIREYNLKGFFGLLNEKSIAQVYGYTQFEKIEVSDVIVIAASTATQKNGVYYVNKNGAFKLDSAVGNRFRRIQRARRCNENGTLR